MSKVTTVAVDIAKRTFDVYSVDRETGEICARTMTRAKFEQFMRMREPSRVVLEAGGSAHYWGRWLERQGHEARLIAPQHVRPFVRTNKLDRGDARAVWEAGGRPEVKWVAVKSEASQAVLALHRVREQLKQMRRMQTNQLKALLYEFGVAATGRVTRQHLQGWIAEGTVPGPLAEILSEQIERIAKLKVDESALTRRIARHNEQDELAKRLQAIEGIGALGASALSAELSASAKSFTSGRQFAACKGITPRMYVRTLLIHGARSVIARRRRTGLLSPWLKGLLERRPFNVAVVALANKMARTAWALAAYARTYQANYAAQAA